MEEEGSRYWCHRCSRRVTPTTAIDVQLKCPLCDDGFVEEMDAVGGEAEQPFDADLRSDRTHFLMGMMDGRGRLARRRALAFTRDGDHDFDAFLMRRRPGDPASMLHLLESLRQGIAFGSDDHDAVPRFGDAEREADGDHHILVNPFRRALLLEGTFIDSDQPPHDHSNLTAASLGDYFIGQGLDLLLQHLADNDPNRYGTPPAQKEAVEAMPNVRIDEPLQCSVCLDDLDIGSEGKEMPCKHVFHSHCILPWLELHSSCPVCRFQIPSLESTEQNGNSSASQNIGFLNNDDNNSDASGTIRRRENEGESGSGGRFSWSFNGLSGSSHSGGTSSDGPSPPT